MRALVGTSGFSYPPWRGRFYPPGLPAEEMLAFYARRFETVELNNSFYRLPTPRQLARWAEQVPGRFVFSLKAPRRITHVARLGGAGDLLSAFLQNAGELGAQLGPILFLLPPSLRLDLALLARFLESLPDGLRAAFEFRHPSWLDDERVFALLRAHGKALCVAETEERSTPLVETAPYGYLRLRRLDYSSADHAAWARRLLGTSWGEVFVYFKHEDQARGPLLAAGLREALGAARELAST